MQFGLPLIFNKLSSELVQQFDDVLKLFLVSEFLSRDGHHNLDNRLEENPVSSGYFCELLVDVLGCLLEIFDMSLNKTLVSSLLQQFDSLVNHLDTAIIIC